MTREECFALAKTYNSKDWLSCLKIHETLAREFAIFNGWRLSKPSFGLGQLARRSNQSRRHEPTLPPHPFDHNYFYREIVPPYRPAAIATHPYTFDDSQFLELATKYGIDVQLIEDFPSWWFPGSTHLILATP